MLPTVADVLALEPVRRGAPRVLAGADRLDVPVRWVHVIELAEAGHLLRGGELVLSTGIALPPDADGLARYVAGLTAAGVSALAVELGSRYVRELPRALVTAARSRRLPLIVLERETQFIAITQAVHAQILDAQVAEVRAAQRLNRVFTGLAVAGAGQDEIVRQASELAAMPVILADLAHRVLACAAFGQEVAELLAGFAGRSRAAVVPGRIGYDAAAGWLVAAVGSAAGDWGRLIFVLPGPPGAGDLVLAERAAATLALARLADGRREESPERTAHRSVLDALTGAAYADLDDLRARIVALGVPLAGRHLLPMVVRVAGGDRLAGVADAVAAACQDLGVPAVAGTLRDRQLAAVLAMASGTGHDETLTRLATRLRRGRVLGPADVIGAGPVAADLVGVPGALREASEAAGAAASLGRFAGDRAAADAGAATVGHGAAAGHGAGRPFVRLADLGLAGLIYQLRDDPRMLAFAERELGPLLLSDERAGTDLAALLAVYLDAGGNKAETARRCGLARPTLYERLRQIEQVTGAGLDDAGSRLALHAALLIRSLGVPMDSKTSPPGAGPCR